MIGRRAILGLPLVAACKRDETRETPPAPSSLAWAPPSPPASSAPSAPSASAASASRKVRVEVLPGTTGALAKNPCVVVVPEARAADERFPVLVALHGQGEARKGPERGAWGWVRDYALDKAHDRLAEGTLSEEDLRGFVTPARLATLRGDLAARAFEGVVVLCAYTPDLLVQPSLDNAKAFGELVVKELLPAARERYPILPGAKATGIDGVSLGGRVSLLVGLAHPTEFGAVGALQAAVQIPEAKTLAKRAKAAREANPELALRLVTSERDFYKEEIAAFHEELTKRGVPHRHEVLPGPHDYPWNRGPGAFEMLLFHDRVLRGRAAV